MKHCIILGAAVAAVCAAADPAAAKTSTEDHLLTISQLYLAGAGSAKIAANYAREVEQEPTTAITGFASLGLSIAVQKITQRHWSKRTKTIVAIGNFIGGTVLAGYLQTHVGATRTELKRARGIP